MKKYKAAFVTNYQDKIDYVYTAAQQQEIAELTGLLPGVFCEADILAGKLLETEVIFATWGMPALTAEMMDKMPKLQAVFYGAGATDSFARACFARDVKVFSAWQANAIPVAEFCLGQILLGLKGYFRYARSLNCKERFNQQLAGPGCYGETVALIGAGAISTKLKELLGAFNVKVEVVPSRKEKRTVSLEEVFAKAMVISNHLPDRNDNIGVLDGKLFASMREGAVFINTGRGRQVNEAEMIEVLKKRPDLTALLDVTSPEPPENGSELYTLPNVFLSAHIAGSLNDEVHRMADYMIAEYKRFANGEENLYEVKESMLLTSKQ
ncbi:MAG: hydroxyacid dehydrogenase [Lentisphaeria bacterium]|nr:hydroxyacid dehydrogenase [Lentisphaeria bacterium]